MFVVHVSVGDDDQQQRLMNEVIKDDELRNRKVTMYSIVSTYLPVVVTEEISLAARMYAVLEKFTYY